MRNRLLSGWRHYVVFAVVVSFGLAPVFAGAKDQITPTIDNPQAAPGLQQVNRDAQSTPSVDGIEPARLYARSNYVWPYSVPTPYSSATREQLGEQGTLRTVVGAMSINELQQALPQELQTANQLDVLEAQYFIVDMDKAWLRNGGAAELSAVVEAAGGRVVGGMPVTAAIALLTRDALVDVQQHQGVKAVVPYQAAFKLHPEIGLTPLANPIKAVSTVYDLDITLFPGEDAQLVAKDIIALGGEVTAAAGRTIRASIDRAKLGRLAQLQSILVIHEAIPNRPSGEETTITMQTGGFQGRGTIGPYHLAGVNGSGNGVPGTAPQVLMIIDTGVQLDGADLANTHNTAGTAGAAHRKVVAYRPASAFSGNGDTLGCDAGPQGGLTHGHLVAATAVGNATNIVDLSTGWDANVKFYAPDDSDLDWTLDGVAPGAKVSVLDAAVTPAAASCNDPIVNDLTVGPNYFTGANPDAACPGATCPGFLQVGYRTTNGDGARVFNMSYTAEGANVYASEARQIDAFLRARQDALVFGAAGNFGTDFDNDFIPDLGSVASPATNKNGLSIGRTGNASLADNAENRFFNSSVGPARVDPGVIWESDPVNSLDRIQPVLMAPGGDGGGLGVASEFVCRTNDNDQNDPVECDITDGFAGTSISSPAAAGAAMLVRDYFAQGFYPTGAQVNANAVPNVSGALVKAILVASADYLNGAQVPTGYRFNNEQGYGRIQLDNVLPLQTWAQSASGLIVADGGDITPVGPNNLSGLDGVLDGTLPGDTDEQTFEVCATGPSLRVALAWMDADTAAGTLATDLDLELVSPSGRTYYGNYFTDDDNRNKVLDANEDCPDLQGNTGVISQGQWSLPICQRADNSLSPHDVANNTEAIFLSYDVDGDGVTEETDLDPSDDDQIEIGTWTVRVKTKDTNPNGTPFIPGLDADSSQRYAVAIAGAACLGSSVRFDSGTYACNEKAEITVNELPESPALDSNVISGRTVVEVFDSQGVLVDSETDLAFTKTAGSESYVGDQVFLTDATQRDIGNGVLDVRDGDTLRVTYTDVAEGNVEVSEAAVDCELRITSGAITFGQFGLDVGTFVNGGCERNARGLFEFGFPDRYPDEDEQLILSVAIGSQETESIENIVSSLRCVIADDALAPEDCRPGTQNCLNPDRLLTGPNAMTECPASWLTVTNSPVTIAELPSAAAIGVNYNLSMGSVIPDMQEVEFVLELTSPTAGRGGTATAVFRNILDADELAVLYSTDFPTGGSEFADWNNNEFLEGCVGDCSGYTGFDRPTDNAGDFFRDYRFETRVFSDMTAGGKNALAAANAPWNFNTNDGGFTNGLAAPTDDSAIIDTIAQWGEDKNFNNQLDGFCAIGKCNVNQAQPCNFDDDCVNSGAGSTCLFDAQGWCGGVQGGTQCTDFDDPLDPDLDPEDCEGDVCSGGFCTKTGNSCSVNSDCTGNTCNLVSCINNPFACSTAGLAGNFRCISESEDIDPRNFVLDSVWGTDGGCGWQTAEAGECTGGSACYIDADCPGGETCDAVAPQYGMWHTGRIGELGAPGCLGAGNNIEQCQGIETVGGETGERVWFELLLTPPIQKVDDSADSVNIMEFSWNQAIDLEDSNVGWSWEVDGDTTSINPVDLTSDGNVLNLGFGSFTPIAGSDGVSENNPDLTNGYSMFAPVFGLDNLSRNGVLGNNRHGQNACYFEGSGRYPLLTLNEFGLAGPLDDDINNGYCPDPAGGPARRGISCNAVCEGGSEDREPCNLDGSDPDRDGDGVDCVSGGGVCQIGSADVFLNRCADDVCLEGTCRDLGVACATNGDCNALGDRDCIFDNDTIDEYVVPNGPIRNMDMNAFNGPELRFTTIEDVAGESAADFQAAIGMVNFEKEDTAAPDPVTSYGIGVDDVVFTWQEFTIVPDAVDCTTGGACATIDSSVGASFNSATFLDITLQDKSPSNNDCNDDGDNTDPGDNTDCNNNGIADVRITGKSENEPAGERLTLDCSNPSGATCPDGEYRGSLPVSATYDSPGVVFVQAQGVINPTVEMNYFDYDDGTGQVCQNSLLANANGLVQAFTQIALSGGNVAVIDTSVRDNGDNDVWADTNETAFLKLTLRNQTGQLLTNVQAKLASNDPKIDCILNANVNVGTMLPDDPDTIGVDEGIVTTVEEFAFRISPSADRRGTCSGNPAVDCGLDADCSNAGIGTCDAELIDYTAQLNVFISSDQFDTAFINQVARIPLDLDALGGGDPAEIVEGFEGGFGIFGINNMDSFNVGADPQGTGAVISGSGGNGGSLANADGFRCSFSDPDYVNAFTFGDPDCFMGQDVNHANTTWWEIVTERAHLGAQSLHWGIYQDDVLQYTTPMGVLESVETVAPLALGFARICSNEPLTACPNGDGDCPGGAANSCIEAKPRAVWKHQVSLMDFRGVNTSGPLRSADGGVIHVQLANPATDAPVGDWIKVSTVANQYDSQKEDNYNVCTFDPIDDGNDEDDFFDPSDPFRRYGPSSTCFPEFVYTYMGDTDGAFDSVAGLGNATQGPGLPGSVGPGTWVESVVDFSQFRAQYVRVRMLVSSIKLAATWQAAFNYEESVPQEDGWFIDDFRIKDAIDAAASLEGDVKANLSVCSGDGTTPCVDDSDCAGNGTCNFPQCGITCNTISPSLVTDPSGGTPAPGQVIELNALQSSADRCVGGVLQYRFWVDEDNSGGAYDDVNDTLLRNWSENAILLQAPSDDAVYAADARCSSLTSCLGTAFATVDVACPDSSLLSPTITADGSNNKNDFQWSGPINYAYAEGPISSLGTNYVPSSSGTGLNGANHTLVSGNGHWLLIRTDNPVAGGGFCNEAGGPGWWGVDGPDGRDASGDLP